MTTELAEGRARRAGWIVGLAAAMVAVAAATVAIQARSRDADAVAGPVVPGFAERARDASRIIVTTRDARYEIQRNVRDEWVLKDRGNYPVRRAALAQFTEGLRSLAYVRPMTRDPEQHERIGLGDPTKGGSGVLVQVEDSQGARIVDLIVGEQPGGAIFVRKPDDAQTWQARGKLPSLRDSSDWLDLAPLDLDKARIARVDVQPREGPAYAVERPNTDTAFALAAPFADRPTVSPTAVPDVAIRLAELQPKDVRPAAAVAGPPKARALLRTFDGLLIDAELFAETDGKFWVKLVARAEKPEKAGEATTLNERVAPWAYGLSEGDYQDVAPLLSALAPAPEPPKAPAKKARR